MRLTVPSHHHFCTGTLCFHGSKISFNFLNGSYRGPKNKTVNTYLHMFGFEKVINLLIYHIFTELSAVMYFGISHNKDSRPAVTLEN